MLSLTKRQSGCRVAIPNHRLLRFRRYPQPRLHRNALLSFSF
ncbi:hypothetical protein Hanom_Chr07g00598741 [Helianthus anomalus]